MKEHEELENHVADDGDLGAHLRQRHRVLDSASNLAFRIIRFPLLIFCRAMIKLEDYGLIGLLIQMACVITIPFAFVMSMIFLPIPPTLKAVISIGTFLTWGILRQDHTDKV